MFFFRLIEVTSSNTFSPFAWMHYAETEDIPHLVLRHGKRDWKKSAAKLRSIRRYSKLCLIDEADERHGQAPSLCKDRTFLLVFGMMDSMSTMQRRMLQKLH